MADTESTGSHALPPAPRAPSTPPAQGWRRDLITAAIALALGTSGGAAVQAANAPEYNEHERRIGVLESKDSGRDVAAINATLVAMNARLARIEDRLDRRPP